ncbi:HlyD family efflux transporter periplasmic adaptor subunit [Desulfofundulus thermobenzoicus]|uniref:HlyD family efflux transporter periplasmic adaptor subunit n=1 Tax=Desulfofundulus thermobenzoicus TaxID=29376 RepID=A0A6N7INK4_9FIRM|nr:HlyD family efflux transporter periplasmic adaptor subunit [Desulfofundulus thermobenzoicus]
MRKRFLKLTAIILTGLVLAGGCAGKDTNKQDLIIDGTVEAQEVDVSIKIPGRIESIAVNEGDKVKAGQVLAYIDAREIKDKRDQAQAALDLARAQYEKAKNSLTLQEKVSEADVQMAAAALEQARAQYDKALNGPRAQQVEQARAKLKEAQAALDVAEKTYQRTKELYASGVIPQQTLDEVKAKYDAAQQEMRYAQEAVSLLEEGTQAEDIRTAAAAVQQARAALAKAEASKIQDLLANNSVQMAAADLKRAQATLAEAQANLDEATVKAPCDGIIVAKNVNTGEMVTPGMPIFTIQQPEKNWVNVKVKETIVGQLKEGQEVTMTSAGFPGKTFNGRIEAIRQKPDFATRRATNDRGDKDLITYNVKIRLDNPELKAGMTVTVNFQQGGGQA